MIEAKITDATAIEQQIRHTQVVRHLEQNGWEKVGHLKRHSWEVPIMQHAQQGDSCVVPPEDAGDYAQRVADIIETLSRIEQRSQLDVFVSLGGELGDYQERSRDKFGL